MRERAGEERVEGGKREQTPNECISLETFLLVGFLVESWIINLFTSDWNSDL